MKNLVLILSILFSTVSCNKNNNNEDRTTDNSKIIGEWQLVEVYESDGGSINQWNAVDNGYNYIFVSDGVFTSSRFTECTNGTYSVSDTTITLGYSCINFNTGIESPEGTFIENFSFDNDNLILVPSYLNCAEGCGWKFSKVNTGE